MDQVNCPAECDTNKSKEEQRASSPSWWVLYKQDIARYKQHRRNASPVALLLAEQGLWALLQYRLASALYRSHLSFVGKVPLLTLAAITQKIIEIVVGILAIPAHDAPPHGALPLGGRFPAIAYLPRRVNVRRTELDDLDKGHVVPLLFGA